MLGQYRQVLDSVEATCKMKHRMHRFEVDPELPEATAARDQPQTLFIWTTEYNWITLCHRN